EANPGAAPGLVEEEIGGDPVQPALERARRVAVQRGEHPDEHVLGEVLCVVAVAGQAVGQPVDASRVQPDDLVPTRTRALLSRVGVLRPYVHTLSLSRIAERSPRSR